MGGGRGAGAGGRTDGQVDRLGHSEACVGWGQHQVLWPWQALPVHTASGPLAASSAPRGLNSPLPDSTPSSGAALVTL